MFRNLGEKATGLIRKLSMASIPKEVEPVIETNIHFSDACFSCDQECEIHPQIPATMQKRIEQTELYKSFKPYGFHVIVPSGKSMEWADHVEEVPGPIQTIQSKTQEFKKRVMVTAYETEQENPGYFIFPQGIQVFPKPDQVDKIQDFLTETTKELEHDIVKNDAFVFICCHKKRDKKCGVAGPLLVQEFKKELELAGLSDKVPVFPISHIGGHKFAGTMIIYRKDARNVFVGDWYGRVKTCHVSTMVKECIQDGKVIQELWRGQMNADPTDPNLDW
jgi:(2Fe-2S) ferredoxin